ncbi:hypothetical protein HDK90DRAFT_470380 [Phyllosticta capitalensis]|uniref:BTB domain-containing protein n=1 Tax=Phyllosticta capitalensis TaxID=121624 RepID=A0ABR1Y9R2_9PEZI
MGDSTVKIFDPDGDVRLLIYDSVEHDTVRKDFLVNSRALSLASDVWKAMFSGRFRESSRSRDEGIEFQDDNPEALATLLSIAHLRFHEVPQESEIKFHQLVGITVLTDKYGATHLLRPWFKSWLESARQYLHKTGYEEWLWIAWELGLVQTFENLSRHLVKSTRLDFDYRLMNKEGDVLHPNLKDLYLPPEIMGTSSPHLHLVCQADYLQKASLKCDRQYFFQSVPYITKSSKNLSPLAAVVRQDAG